MTMLSLTNLISLTFAALIVAAPLSSPSSQAPCLSSEFTLAMLYNGAHLSLGAIDNGHAETLSLVGFPESAYRGTPVKQTGVSPNATLALDVKPGTDCETTQTGKFGISVPDLGELYGVQVPIVAAKGVSWPHFFVGDLDVEPLRTAASQSWYACNITILGKEYVGLSWGLYNSNGSSPWGCEYTTVSQRFNIPCAGA